MSDFAAFFSRLTGHDRPRVWQNDLARESEFRDQLIRIPTGLGKTEGVLAAWSFHRLARGDERWPRRLVWCLPMRVLVEQTAEVADKLTARVTEVLQIPKAQAPTVHVAMGGEDAGEWFLFPERPAIIIGTQDMLLSRALNRGFGGARARWPVEFGLLNQDALWVMDEVQLMDVGLATSAQLQAYRQQDEAKGLRPCRTWWMSATLQPDWLKTVDTAEYHDAWIQRPCAIGSDQLRGGLWEVSKSLEVVPLALEADRVFAERILEEHAKLTGGEYGRITLIVCNTVDRACETFEALRSQGRTEGLELVHSRFRPQEREKWKNFLARSACTAEADRIIVATQVVEAGVDISSGCLITELAPWPNLVQRFGRCARYGGAGRVLVIDRGRDDRVVAPYQAEELDAASESLRTLDDVGLAALEEHEAKLSDEQRDRLYPYTPSHLLLRREFDELFDTTPDLTGADLDVSRFIRSGEERDLQVFWIAPEELEKDKPPPGDRQPHRRELCAVPFLNARNWLCGEESKSNRKPRLLQRFRRAAWIWDWVDGEWVEAERARLLPGRIVCVAARCGGYQSDRGFNAESSAMVETLPPEQRQVKPATKKNDQADAQNDGDASSFTKWKTIACHSSEVVAAAREIAEALPLPDELRRVLLLAAAWHDWGKAHPAFQNMLLRKRAIIAPNGHGWAKSDDVRGSRPRYFAAEGDRDERRGFRHELASALALFGILEAFAPQHPALLGTWSEAWAALGRVEPSPSSAPLAVVQPILDCSAEAFDLLVYLVAAHHGKVRAALHAAPHDQEYRIPAGDAARGLPIRGVREGDRLPPVVLASGLPPTPEITLNLEPAMLGLSPRIGAGWRERCQGLVERFGPGGLAFLESLLRAADVRASRLKTEDPALHSEGTR